MIRLSTGPLIDPIEVLRPVTTTPQALVASLAGAIAAAGLVAVLALAVLAVVDQHRGRDVRELGAPRWLLATVAVASVAQLGLIVLPREMSELGTVLITRQPGALVARLLLVAVLALLRTAAADTRTAVAPVTLTWLWALTAVLAVATVPPATAGVAQAGAVLRAGTLLMVLTVGGAVGLARARRATDPRRGVMIAWLLLAAATAGVVVVLSRPEPPPAFHAERLGVDGVSLDVTIAPVRPGRNEFHLYAWDATDGEVDLTSAEVLLHDGTDPTRFELLRVSPNHHLSYILELPEPGPWELTIVARRPTGGSLRTTTSIQELP